MTEFYDAFKTKDRVFKGDMRLARAYISYQKFTRVFPPQEGLMKGTAFPKLYMPYKKRLPGGV